jgi:hypothetical protein
MRTAMLLPSILRRLDDLLLVKELNAKIFGNWLNEGHLHTAISAPSASAEFDYERLELLGTHISNPTLQSLTQFIKGDAYLKYLSSVYLFVKRPQLHEGALHIERQKIISNRNLLRRVGKSEVPQYVQSKPFAAKTWLPFNFVVAQLGPKDTSAQQSNGVCAGPQSPREAASGVADLDMVVPEDVPSTEPNSTAHVVGEADTNSSHMLPALANPNNNVASTTAQPTTPEKKLPFSAQAKRLAESNVQHLGDKVLFFPIPHIDKPV